MNLKILSKPIGLALAATLVSVPSAALAAPGLAISSAVKVPATVPQPAHVKLTATCVLGAGPVTIYFRDTASGNVIRVFQTLGPCNPREASTGQTVSIKLTAAPPGTYMIILKQGSGGTSAPFGPITLP